MPESEHRPAQPELRRHAHRPRHDRLDPTTLLFTLALAGFTAMLFGLLPAWQASRSDMVHTMKAGAGSIAPGTGGAQPPQPADRRRNRAGAGAARRRRPDADRASGICSAPGSASSPTACHVVAVTCRARSYDGRSRRSSSRRELLDDVRAQPGVQSAAFGNCAPVSGGCNGTLRDLAGPAAAAPGTAPAIGMMPVSPEYFQTLGIRLIEGRTFTDRDRDGQPRVVGHQRDRRARGCGRARIRSASVTPAQPASTTGRRRGRRHRRRCPLSSGRGRP